MSDHDSSDDVFPTADLPNPQARDASDPFWTDPTKASDTEIGEEFAAAAPPLPAGTMIDVFKIEGLAGRGGMGEVYRAIDTILKREVAIKIVSEGYTTNAEFVARFDREARAASALSHANIAQVYSTGRFGARPYYVMEFVRGRSLAQILSDEGPITGFRCLSYMQQACDALNAAYEKGIVHRDIKPDNLMLDPTGRLKVVDFGLARWVSDESKLTQTSVVMGTPNYMAPEQILGEKVDHRADIYSLGTSFYHLFSGQVPFQADTAVGIMMKHVNDDPVPLKTLNARIPAPICGIVEKMMAKRADQRYQTYAQIMRDLKLAQSGQWKESVAAKKPPPKKEEPKRPRMNLALAATVGGLAIVVIALSVGYARMRQRAEAGPGTRVVMRDAPARGGSPAATATSDALPETSSDVEAGSIVDSTAENQPAEETPVVELASTEVAAPAPHFEDPAPTPAETAAPPPSAPLEDPTTRKKNEAKTTETMQVLAAALSNFTEEGAAVPRTLGELAEGFDIQPEGRRDAWGHDLTYEARGSRGYRIASAGSDGRFDTDDDLVMVSGKMIQSGAP